MTRPNGADGAHGNAGATEANTTNPASFTTDATLQASAKKPGGGHGKTVWTSVVLLAVLALVALAVWQPWASKAQAEATPGKAADTVSVGLKLAPTNLDIRNTAGSALDQALIGNVYEGLVARDSENQVVPALAKSWEESKDGLTYTFHLRQGVTFSNGDPLTAEDVVWSINELVDKQYHDADQLVNFKSIKATNDDTVVITLTKPYSNLLWALTGRAGLVFDKDAKYVAKTQAVGSGPYEVASFTPNSSLTLTENPDYWGTKPKTKTIVLKYFTDDNAAVNTLSSGDVQVLAPISASLAKPFEEDSANYTVQAGDGTDKYVLGMNNAKDKATSDKRVRQAIRYAIDHDELIASRGGVDAALGGPIPSLDPGYEDLTDLYPYNPDKAKELLKEAGYDEDHPLKLTLTYANTYGTEIGEQLRSQLAKVGIDLKVNVVEFSTWLQDVYTDKDYDLSLVDHNESHDFTQWANKDYYYNYDNATVQQLTAEALDATSDSTRDELLAKAARTVSEDAAADWLFNYRITTAAAKGVEGWPLNMNQTVMPLSDLTYTPAE
ncbi:MAG: ABC transporter substrate-binding protein [Bifidobacterium sp.]|nr:ABC transporter substrate-binding protein [Bifidobacterium sp.]